MVIAQVTANDSGVFGLGDDGKLYKFDFQNRVWIPQED
jgi:hypothetical protein